MISLLPLISAKGEDYFIVELLRDIMLKRKTIQSPVLKSYYRHLVCHNVVVLTFKTQDFQGDGIDGMVEDILSIYGNAIDLQLKVEVVSTQRERRHHLSRQG